MRFARLHGNTVLKYANLDRAILREAKLYNVNLQCASLCYADLQGGMMLHNVDLKGANLIGAKYSMYMHRHTMGNVDMSYALISYCDNWKSPTGTKRDVIRVRTSRKVGKEKPFRWKDEDWNKEEIIRELRKEYGEAADKRDKEENQTYMEVITHVIDYIKKEFPA